MRKSSRSSRTRSSSGSARSRRRVGRSRQRPKRSSGCVLSRPDLIEEIRSRRLVFTPEISSGAIRQASIDLRLGRKFSIFKAPDPNSYVASIRIGQARQVFEQADLWHHVEQDRHTLRPQELVLAQTLERVTLPNDLMGFVEGRSSWARLGVSIHVTAPKIDPGFVGTITLEIVNHGPIAYELVAGEDEPCQLILMRLTSALAEHELYGAIPDEDIFANQTSPIPRKRR